MTLERDDEFAGQCAGAVAVKAGGKKAEAAFEFGDVPPAEGGPAKDVAKVKLSRPLRDRLADAARRR